MWYNFNGEKDMKKVEKEFELVNRIIERHWNRAIGLANAESLQCRITDDLLDRRCVRVGETQKCAMGFKNGRGT